MMSILLEKIVAPEKPRGTLTLVFNDGTKIKVLAEHIADFGLYDGLEIPDDEFEALLEALALSGAKARAMRMLGRRAMSRREVVRKLVEKGEREDLAELAADWCESSGAVNDAEYAAMIVSHYEKKGYGRKRIKDELYRRGIGRGLWDEALEDMSEESDAAIEFLRRRLSGADADRAAIKRATDALSRRGFSWGEIRDALRKYTDEETDL